MKRLLTALMAIMLMILPCVAEEEQAAFPETACLPEGMLMETETAAMRRYIMEATGEAWTVLQTGNVCCAVAELSWDGSVTPEEFIALRWPDAWILASGDDEWLFMDLGVAGRCTWPDGGIVIEMSFGEYRSSERMLTDGAIAAMALYRPQATITEIELDNDDGLVIFEGEAFVNGVEYEFELDAYSGRLLEWERD